MHLAQGAPRVRWLRICVPSGRTPLLPLWPHGQSSFLRFPEVNLTHLKKRSFFLSFFTSSYGLECDPKPQEKVPQEKVDFQFESLKEVIAF